MPPCTGYTASFIGPCGYAPRPPPPRWPACPAARCRRSVPPPPPPPAARCGRASGCARRRREWAKSPHTYASACIPAWKVMTSWSRWARSSSDRRDAPPPSSCTRSTPRRRCRDTASHGGAADPPISASGALGDAEGAEGVRVASRTHSCTNRGGRAAAPPGEPGWKMGAAGASPRRPTPPSWPTTARRALEEDPRAIHPPALRRRRRRHDWPMPAPIGLREVVAAEGEGKSCYTRAAAGRARRRWRSPRSRSPRSGRATLVQEPPREGRRRRRRGRPQRRRGGGAGGGAGGGVPGGGAGGGGGGDAAGGEEESPREVVRAEAEARCTSSGRRGSRRPPRSPSPPSTSSRPQVAVVDAAAAKAREGAIAHRRVTPRVVEYV